MSLLADSPESEGWDYNRYLLAGIFDVIRENTTLTGMFKKDPNLPTWPRPEDVRAEEEKKPITVADLFAQMNGRAHIIPD